ncbi:hypothetical protein ACXR8F_09220 [Terrabacter sp. AAH1]
MADTKQTKSIGEHHVCAMLARLDWAPALTRDGLARTDILAVHTDGDRPMIEVQVKSIRGAGDSVSWPLGLKSQCPAVHDREWFVLVAIPADPLQRIRNFVVPRDHVAAAAWVEHMHWLTEPGIAPGKRNVGVDRARSQLSTFKDYEDRWDLLLSSTNEAPVLLPSAFRDWAEEAHIGLPPDHPWLGGLPVW